ncbi:uncharacterized protein LOC110891105 [Helianthus annuus]|uniref:uncharacterized protein LOC110891105 n=1 Tax=Helianthus annuus TaxID=4232 RepID=UPI001652DCAE|nr:uncharacterized protein LOC110891105 [Helianthus annuus]
MVSRGGKMGGLGGLGCVKSKIFSIGWVRLILSVKCNYLRNQAPPSDSAEIYSQPFKLPKITAEVAVQGGYLQFSDLVVCSIFCAHDLHFSGGYIRLFRAQDLHTNSYKLGQQNMEQSKGFNNFIHQGCSSNENQIPSATLSHALTKI